MTYPDLGWDSVIVLLWLSWIVFILITCIFDVNALFKQIRVECFYEQCYDCGELLFCSSFILKEIRKCGTVMLSVKEELRLSQMSTRTAVNHSYRRGWTQSFTIFLDNSEEASFSELLVRKTFRWRTNVVLLSRRSAWDGMPPISVTGGRDFHSVWCEKAGGTISYIG